MVVNKVKDIYAEPHSKDFIKLNIEKQVSRKHKSKESAEQLYYK